MGRYHPQIAHRLTLDRPIHQSIVEQFNRTSNHGINEIQITNHISKHRNMCLHQPSIPAHSCLPAPNQNIDICACPSHPYLLIPPCPLPTISPCCSTSQTSH